MITFQTATPGDAETMLRFIRAFYIESEDLIFDEVLTPVALNRLLYDASLGYAWLLKENDTPVGYVIVTLGYSLEYYGRDAFIDELFLEEAYQGRGYGRATLALIEEFCASIGVHALHLEADRKNTRVRSFYHNAGFLGHDRYLMTKLIG